MDEKKYDYKSYILQFERAKNQADRLAEGADKSMLLQKPSQDAWSAAECMQHLVQFGDLYFDSLNLKLEHAESDPFNSGAVFKPRAPFRIISHYLEPPYTFKIKTLSPFKPDKEDASEAADAFKRFTALQERFIDQIKRCRQKGIDLSNEKISNPVFTFIKMTLADCYSLIAAHQRRHLWQAEQIVSIQENDATQAGIEKN